jgi:pimeloyl-ACP methyl ester carboxylesterase
MIACTMTKRKMKIKKRSLAKILLILIAILFLGSVTFTGLLHSRIRSSFPRGDYPTYPVVNYDYEYYRSHYPRVEVPFYSGSNQLRGYLYGDPSANRLLIFSHGLGSGHESYMKEIIYMVDAGYLVFAYDGTGSCTSEGESTVGVLQSALDLDAAFDYISSSDALRTLPIYLMGHSWGGFAAAEALGRHNHIVAAVSLAGYAYPVDLLIDRGSQMLNQDLNGMEFFVNISHLITYGLKNFRRNAVDSINSSDTPILLVHGNQDHVIPLDKTSIIAYQDKLNNPRVETYVISREGQNGHSSIFYSAEAVPHIALINENFAIKMNRIEYLPEQERGEYAFKCREELVKEANLPLINQVNEELFARILNFFDEASH